MSRKFMVVALVLSVASLAEAGPFGLVRTRRPAAANTNQGGNSVAYDAGELGSAQGVANRMARLLRIGHFGNPAGGWEGVGSGATPDQAIRNCCYYGQRQIKDSGCAQGHNGMWFACCRYW
jgi:hypothetical protein